MEEEHVMYNLEIDGVKYYAAVTITHKGLEFDSGKCIIFNIPGYLSSMRRSRKFSALFKHNGGTYTDIILPGKNVSYQREFIDISTHIGSQIITIKDLYDIFIYRS